jgi:hypothetical protein
MEIDEATEVHRLQPTVLPQLFMCPQRSPCPPSEFGSLVLLPLPNPPFARAPAPRSACSHGIGRVACFESA